MSQSNNPQKSYPSHEANDNDFDSNDLDTHDLHTNDLDTAKHTNVIDDDSAANSDDMQHSNNPQQADTANESEDIAVATASNDDAPEVNNIANSTDNPTANSSTLDNTSVDNSTATEHAVNSAEANNAEVNNTEANNAEVSIAEADNAASNSDSASSEPVQAADDSTTLPIEQEQSKSTLPTEPLQATDTDNDPDNTTFIQPAANTAATQTSYKELGKEEKPKDEEEIIEEKEAKLESYKQFVAEQASTPEIDYQKIRINIEANALPNRMYFIMNALSAVIASYGLVINSAAVVIGAMLVAMMLGPISGVALALIDYRMPFLKKSLLTVLAGGVMVISIGFVIGLLHQGQPLTNEILSRTQPTSMDLMIALAGGTAGAYAIISPNLSVAVVGVAVATALVPPLAASGILFANGEMTLAFGALLLAITNIIAIQFTNALVLWFSGFRRLVKDDYKSGTYKTFIRRNAVPLLLLVGLGIYLSVNLSTIARTQRFENDVNTVLSDYFVDKGNVLAATQFVSRDDHQVIRAVIRGVSRPTPADVMQLEQQISQRMQAKYPKLPPVHLQLRYLPVVVIESHPNSVDRIDQTDAAILSNEN